MHVYMYIHHAALNIILVSLSRYEAISGCTESIQSGLIIKHMIGVPAHYGALSIDLLSLGIYAREAQVFAYRRQIFPSFESAHLSGFRSGTERGFGFFRNARRQLSVPSAFPKLTSYSYSLYLQPIWAPGIRI